VGELLGDKTVKSIYRDISMRMARPPEHLGRDSARASKPAPDFYDRAVEMSSLPERIKVEIEPFGLQ
jgi:hypothetical protein